MPREPTNPTAEQFEQALARLRPIEREVLRLRAREGLPDAEVAARLGISASAVEPILVAALCNLDRQLERLTRPWWRLW